MPKPYELSDSEKYIYGLTYENTTVELVRIFRSVDSKPEDMLKLVQTALDKFLFAMLPISKRKREALADYHEKTT